MRYLGIDYGTKKAGIALSDEEGRMAFPHSVIENNDQFLDTVLALIEKEQIAHIVMGRSHNLDGTPNPVDAEIDTFADMLKKHTGIDVSFEPEHFSSQEAMRIQGRTDMTDAAAAALLLNSYLSRSKL